MRSSTHIHKLILGVAVVLLLGGCATAAQGPVVQGSIAPVLPITTLAGAPSEVQAESGQALWLNFWASWCSPCRAEWPDLNAAQRDLAGADLRLVAISVNEPADKVRSFLDGHPASFAVALDPQGAAAQRYGVLGFPTHVLIDKAGVVRAIVRGPLDAARARRLLGLVEDGPTH